MGHHKLKNHEEAKARVLEHARLSIESLILQYAGRRYASFYPLPARREVGEDCITTFVEEHIQDVVGHDSGYVSRDDIVHIFDEMVKSGLIEKESMCDCYHLSLTDEGRKILDKQQDKKQQKESSLREDESRGLEHVGM